MLCTASLLTARIDVPTVRVTPAVPDEEDLSMTRSATTAGDVLEDLLHRRHSCRAFLDEQVPAELIEKLFGLGQRAASWCNAQPWQVVVTSGAATERFREALLAGVEAGGGTYDIDPPAEYVGAYQARRRACGFALYDSVGIAKDDKVRRVQQAMENYRFFGAPHVAIVTAAAGLGPYAYVDCGAYIGTVQLAAEALGLGMIAQAAVANYSNVVREHLQIPEDQRIVCALSFGFRDPEHPVNAFRTERAGLDEALRVVAG
jgi:nitroreductase